MPLMGPASGKQGIGHHKRGLDEFLVPLKRRLKRRRHPPGQQIESRGGKALEKALRSDPRATRARSGQRGGPAGPVGPNQLATARLLVRRKHLFRLFPPRYHTIPWCSGYHICLTRRRSPVRSWAESVNFLLVVHSSLTIYKLLSLQLYQENTLALKYANTF